MRDCPPMRSGSVRSSRSWAKARSMSTRSWPRCARSITPVGLSSSRTSSRRPPSASLRPPPTSGRTGNSSRSVACERTFPAGSDRWRPDGPHPLAGPGRLGPRSTIVAVTEPFEAAAAQLREQGLAVYPTVEEMFASSELDGVLIAVPTPQHIDTTRKALEAGLPVLCEKPFGLVPDGGPGAGRTRRRPGPGAADRLLATVRAAADVTA